MLWIYVKIIVYVGAIPDMSTEAYITNEIITKQVYLNHSLIYLCRVLIKTFAPGHCKSIVKYYNTETQSYIFNYIIKFDIF